MATVLVIDDDSGVAWAFSRLLEKEGHKALSASSAEEGLELAAREKPEMAFVDVRLPGMDGLAAAERLRGMLPGSPVVIMTGHGTLSTAVEAVRGGAFDYLLKPVSLETVRALLRRALSARAGRPALEEARRQLADFPPEALLVGRGPAMQELYRQIAAAAAGDATVLLCGESGTGKELAARAIHLHSARSGGPFVAVNCAGIPETLLESELFGHARGAYTGAVSARVGRLEAAEGGTVLLDEVGEMSAAMQAKLLRFLESHCFERLGESQTRRADVRVISATHRDLRGMVPAGLFREDLYYRLDVLRVELPPLRARPEDIALLAAHFLSARSGEPVQVELSPEALAVLERYEWPGNVRELRNCLEHAAALARGSGTITAEHLPAHVLRAAGTGRDADAGSAGSAGSGLAASADRLLRQMVRRRLEELAAAGTGDGELLAETVRIAERAAISEVLTVEGGNQVQAARRLGMHRTTLRKKIDEFGMAGGEEQ